MGITERKQKEKEIRKNDIINAAERVFFTKGYAVATMDDVAKEAEFSKRTVYVYFNSKEQIYFEIMLRGYKLLIHSLEKDLSNQQDIHALERIKQIGHTLYTFNEQYPNYFEAIVEYETGEMDFDKGITDSSREECYKLGEKVLAILIEALAQGIEEGAIRKEIDVLDTALVLWSCTIGAFTIAKRKANYIKHYHKRESKDLIFNTFELLIRSIKS
ncbi:TetR/AcrR family transcriptional regulator [Priestia megaterium]|nr:TetR/AcrR family transcriptional regulator [Priestia megaterium]